MIPGGQLGQPNSGSSQGGLQGSGAMESQGMAHVMGIRFGQTGFGTQRLSIPSSLQPIQNTSDQSKISGSIGVFAQNTKLTSSITSVFGGQSMHPANGPDPKVGFDALSLGTDQSRPMDSEYAKSTPFQSYAHSIIGQAQQTATSGDWMRENKGSTPQLLPRSKSIFEDSTVPSAPAFTSVFGTAGPQNLFAAGQQAVSFGGPAVGMIAPSQQPPASDFMQIADGAPGMVPFNQIQQTSFTPVVKSGGSRPPAWDSFGDQTAPPNISQNPDSLGPVDSELPPIFIEAFQAQEFTLGKIPGMPPPSRFV